MWKETGKKSTTYYITQSEWQIIQKRPPTVGVRMFGDWNETSDVPGAVRCATIPNQRILEFEQSAKKMNIYPTSI